MAKIIVNGRPTEVTKITVIVPDPGDYSHVHGVFRFGTWREAATFVEKLAEQEARVMALIRAVADKCHTCYDNGCGESDGDGIMSPRIRMCDGDCGDGCKTSRPVADCGDNCPCRKQDWKGG